jgi:hypothetical protein
VRVADARGRLDACRRHCRPLARPLAHGITASSRTCVRSVPMVSSYSSPEEYRSWRYITNRYAPVQKFPSQTRANRLPLRSDGSAGRCAFLLSSFCSPGQKTTTGPHRPNLGPHPPRPPHLSTSTAAGRATAGAGPGRGPQQAVWRGAAVLRRLWPPSPCRGAAPCGLRLVAGEGGWCCCCGAATHAAQSVGACNRGPPSSASASTSGLSHPVLPRQL